MVIFEGSMSVKPLFLRVLLLVAGLFLFETSRADVYHPRNVDSLKQVLQGHPQEDTVRVLLYLNISEAYLYLDRGLSRIYADSGRVLAEKLDYPYGRIFASQRLGLNDYQNARFKEAERWFRKCLALSEELNEHRLESSLYGSLGINKFAAKDMDSSIFYLKKSIELELLRGDTNGLINRYNNLGAIYHSMGSTTDMMMSFFKSLSLAELAGKKDRVFFIANNIGVVFSEVGDARMAINYFKRALKAQAVENSQTSVLYTNTGDAYFDLGQYDSALYCYELAQEIPLDGDICQRAYIFLGKAESFLARGEQDLFFEMLDSVQVNRGDCRHSEMLFRVNMGKFEASALRSRWEEAALSLDSAELYSEGRSGFRLLWIRGKVRLYESFNQIDSVAYYLKRENILVDSLNNQSSTLLVSRLEIEHSLENERFAEKVKFELDRANLHAEMEGSRLKLWLAWGSIAAILVVVVILLIAMWKVKKVNLSLNEKNKTIDKQRSELLAKAEQLQDSHHQVKALSEFRERLAHMAVHDMKNPLNTILGFSQGDVDGKKAVKIRGAATKMLSFVTNLLDIYKMENASITLNLERVKLVDIVKEAMAEVEFLANEKGVSIRSNLKVSVDLDVDVELLRRVVINLLTNAIKYSDAGGIVDVMASLTEEKHVQLSVRDYGEGIASQHLPEMFKDFAKKKEQFIEGSKATGIGLNFCLLAVKALKGGILVESELNQGTTVVVDLPVQGVVLQEIDQVEVKMYSRPPSSEFMRQCLGELEVLKVHEAGKVLKILNSIEDEFGESTWLQEAYAVVYASDQAKFDEVIMKLYD